MEEGRTRVLDNCIIDITGPLRVEKLGEDLLVLGEEKCFYASDSSEAHKLMRELIIANKTGNEVESLNCDRCSLDMMVYQSNVLIGEDICCSRCAMLNPSDVLYSDAVITEESDEQPPVRPIQAALDNIDETPPVFEAAQNGKKAILTLKLIIQTLDSKMTLTDSETEDVDWHELCEDVYGLIEYYHNDCD